MRVLPLLAALFAAATVPCAAAVNKRIDVRGKVT